MLHERHAPAILIKHEQGNKLTPRKSLLDARLHTSIEQLNFLGERRNVGEVIAHDIPLECRDVWRIYYVSPSQTQGELSVVSAMTGHHKRPFKLVEVQTFKDIPKLGNIALYAAHTLNPDELARLHCEFVGEHTPDLTGIDANVRRVSAVYDAIVSQIPIE